MTPPDTRKNPNSDLPERSTSYSNPEHEYKGLAAESAAAGDDASIVTVTSSSASSLVKDINVADHISGNDALLVSLKRSPPMSPALLHQISCWLEDHRPAFERQRRRKATLARNAARRSSDRRYRPAGCVAWPALDNKTKQIRRLEAMKAAGRCFPITLLLSSERIVRAEREKRPLEWLAARIGLALKKCLGRRVDMILFDQHNPAGKLHLHGVIVMSEAEKVVVTDALRKSLGEFQDVETQIVIRDLIPDSGWIGYILDGQDDRHSSYSTHAVTARARALHEELRNKLLARRADGSVAA